MNKEIFEFDDNRVNEQVARQYKMIEKIKHSMSFLEKYLPVNQLTKDNSFDFSKIKFDEGKNYDWFFLVNEKVTILVRQYSSHFTFFTINKGEHSYFDRLSIFTINDDSDKMTDKESDQHCNDNFHTLSTLLPSLVKMIEEDDVHSLWNSLSFVRPKFTDVKIAFIGQENVQSLDLLIFACDEIFQMYLEKFAENDMLDRIKELSVGDIIGSYTISSITTKVEAGYYHGVGLKKYRTDDETKKDEWNDVYSLTRWYYEDVFFNITRNQVQNFLYDNHNEILEKSFIKDIFVPAQFTNKYVENMHALFVAAGNDVEIKVFHSFFPKDFMKFLEQAYIVKLKSK